MGTDVVVLRLFPGITQQTIEAVLGIPSLRGVVLETYGAGNAMTYDWFLNALHNAVKRGIIIMNVSQCLGGSVEMGIYETGNQLSKAGVIGAMDMTTEATVVKLMFLLGQGYSQSEIEKLMLQNISGEITV
jgi:L-asparaginase